MAKKKADAVKKKAPKSGPGAEMDVYTGLLGLTLMAMIGTTVWVCMKSMEFFETLF